MEMYAKPSFLERELKEGQWITVTGTVCRREERPDTTLYYLKDNQVQYKHQIIKEPYLLVYFKQEHQQKQMKIGNQIQWKGTVSFFEASTNPGGFDRRRHYQKQNIVLSLKAKEATQIDSTVWVVREHLQQFRERWKELLQKTMGVYYGNCMAAILLGDKSELNAEVKDLYQKSGIGHILAISGLHMSFLGSGFYKLLRKAGASFFLSGSCGIVFLLLYTVMIGGGVSAKRALIMFIIHVGADMAGRDYDLSTSLFVAAFGIVLGQPLYLFDAGFLLSFGALVGVAVFYPVFDRLALFPKYLRASISIQLILLPIMLYFYYEIPPYSIVLNLFVIPLMSVVLSAGIFGSVLSFAIRPIGTVLLYVSKGILWLYEVLSHLTLQLPYGRVILGQPSKGWCLTYYSILVCLLCLLLWLEKKKKISWLQEKIHGFKRACLVDLGILGLCFLFCVGTTCCHGLYGNVIVTAIDVGQGDGIYIRTPTGKHLLVDGGSTTVKEVGKYRIEPFLKSQGVGRLAYVFVSHGDEDHIGGIREMLLNQDRGVKIDTLVFPTRHVLDEALLELAKVAQEQNTEVVTMGAGQTLFFGKMTMTCLAPEETYDGPCGNEASMVLELSYKKFQMLFTGDLEGRGEDQLVGERKIDACDVLKAAHHGSKNSSSEEMLALARPKITLISAGKENRYGHPHKELLQRLQDVKSAVYCTKENGAIRLWSNGTKLKIATYVKGREFFCKMKIFLI